MRHSRRLSSHPAQPQGPFCSRCEVNLSTFPAYIRCADPECRSIPICVDCFSVGAADELPHQPEHPYRIVEKLSQSIYVNDWAAHEELRLLEALSEHGPHHWKAIADYVGKTQRKCELHYETLYLKGPNAPLPTSMLGESAPAPSPAASSDAIDDADVPDTKPGQEDTENANTGNQRKLKNKDSESESGILEGFMPLRGDFDIEWDDKAEELIADLIINADDSAEEKDLKMRLLIMYDQRLQRRNAVKEFLFDHKLLEFAKLKYDDRRGTRDEKELSARLQVFSRLLSKPEFDAFYSSVMTEYRISRDMYRMAQARKAGIRTKPEVDIYEVERKARYQRLSEQAKSEGKEKCVGKRRRSSAVSDTPTPTPLNSVPGTPGSMVLSPSSGISPEGEATPERQNESNAVRVRKARERKRIARSPYPVLEAMPVEEMEDSWKLSQTEKKLCSALRIPPSEFLRMRDAMLYTASQNIKRRGRPRKRGTNTPVLTIRARKQTKVTSKNQPRQHAQFKDEPAMILDTVPLTSPHQQRVILRQAIPSNPAPPPNSGARVMLTCKPPAAAAEGSEKKAPAFSSTPVSNLTNEDLRLNLKVVPVDSTNPSARALAKEASSTPTAPGVVDTDDLPLSATFAQSQKRKELSSAASTIAVETAVMNAHETADTKANETPMDKAKQVVTGEEMEPSKSGAKEGNQNVMESDKTTNAEEKPNPVVRPETMEIEEGPSKVEKLKEAEKDSQGETPESVASCEADIIHVSTLDRPRPVTRSHAKQATYNRENIKMHLTRVSRSNSPCEGPENREIRRGPQRTVVNVTAVQVERPVTRAYAAQVLPKLEDSGNQLSSPILESAKVDMEDGDSQTNAPDDPCFAKGSSDGNVKNEGTSNDCSSRGTQPIPIEMTGESGSDPIATKVKRSLVSGSSNAHDDESSSTDEIDEVLCGEDGAKQWSSRVRGLDESIERSTHMRTRNGSPDVDVTSAPVKAGTFRNGSDGEELLDHGRASVDSTIDRSSNRLAKKQPKTPERVSQRLRSKKAVLDSTPNIFAQKHPRHVKQDGATPRKTLEDSNQLLQKEIETNRESKETEVTIDGEGEVDDEQNTRMAERHDGISDGSDSVEILSGGEGDDVDPTVKNPDQVEEVTLDEGQDAAGEESKDATWTTQDSGLDDGPEEVDKRANKSNAAPLHKPSSQAETGTEPGTPGTNDHDREFRHFGNLIETGDDRRKRKRAPYDKETIPVVRKSRRVQRPSRRLEESVEAAVRPAKRRRMSGREARPAPVAESPMSDSEEQIDVRSCAVITDQVGNTSFDDMDQADGDVGTVSKQFRPDTSRAKKSSRQSTPSKLKYPVSERRITRSAGRQTRSRSANLRRSLTDRLGIRRG